MSNNPQDFLSNDMYNGELFKRGKINKNWKQRHFTVYRNAQRIEYYASAQDAAQKKDVCGTINLSNASNIEVLSGYDLTLINQLPEYIDHNDKLKSNKHFTFQLVLNSRTYVFAALGQSQFFEWINYLQSCLYGGIVKQGWLKKLGAVKKNWKKRYFVLNQYQQMKYFEDTQKAKLLGLIDCTKILSVTNGKYYSNELRYTLELNTKARNWIISAQDKQQRLEWARFINALKSADWKQQLDKIENEEKENVASIRIRYSVSTAKSPNTPSSRHRTSTLTLFPVVKLQSDVVAMFEAYRPSNKYLCDIAENVCLKRIIYVLKMYKEYLSQIENESLDSFRIRTIYEQITQLPNYGMVEFVNDFYHLLLNYDDKFEEIYNLLVQEMGDSNLSTIECQRMYRDRMDMDMREKLYFGEQNSIEISCQQIFDRVFCHFFHSFDVGFKLTDSEQKQMESKQDDNDDHGRNDDIDHVKERMYKIMKEKIKNLYTLLGENRFVNNKFIHIVEERKTDVLDDMNVFGITWYYWDYYKYQRDLQDPWSANGKTFGDLSIEQNYMTTKLELLHNKICPITIQQFNDLREKTNFYTKTDEIKRLKAKQCNAFGIKNGSLFHFDYIIAILMYCNFDIFRNSFCSTFRKIESDKSFQDIKKRHAQFSNIGRLLREMVCCFSEKLAFKQTIYMCVNTEFMFIDNSLQFKNPLSATGQYNIIVNYCSDIGNKNGLILELKFGALNRSHRLPFFDTKLLNDFSNESEKLFIGGNGYFLMNNLIKLTHISYCDYSAYIKCIHIFKSFINSHKLSVAVNENHKNMLLELINHHFQTKSVSELSTKSKYVYRLFRLYCDCVAEYYINFNIIKKNYFFLYALFVNEDNNCLKLKDILNIFPNVQKIEIKNNLGYGIFSETVVLSQSFIENILQILVNNNDLKLNELVIYCPNETEMKLASVVTTYKDQFNQINWTLYTTKQEKRDTSNDLVRIYSIKILTLAKL